MPWDSFGFPDGRACYNFNPPGAPASNWRAFPPPQSTSNYPSHRRAPSVAVARPRPPAPDPTVARASKVVCIRTPLSDGVESEALATPDPYPSPPGSNIARSSPFAQGPDNRGSPDTKPAWFPGASEDDDPAAILSGLTPHAMEDLIHDHTGRLILRGVTDSMFRDWESMYPEVREADNINFEYDASTSRFMIKCVVSPVHQSVTRFFNSRLAGVLPPLLGEEYYDGNIHHSSGDSWDGFTGGRMELSDKIPDFFVQVAGEHFPRVVLETGWAEGMPDLIDDAKLWLLHSEGGTRVVVVVAFTEVKAEPPPPDVVEADNQVAATEVDAQDDPADPADPPDNPPDDSNPPAPESLGSGDSSASTDDYPEELALLASIDTTTVFSNLTQSLLTLHRLGQLSKPLLGRVDATLHIFRLSPGGSSITETFSATILPEPSAAAPQSFALTVDDLLGPAIAADKNLDPRREIEFPLSRLRRHIAQSIPKMEEKRATGRAKALMKERGVWEGGMTFAMMKRAKRKRTES